MHIAHGPRFCCRAPHGRSDGRQTRTLQVTATCGLLGTSLITSVAALPMVLFVPAFYADQMGLPIAAVGMALAASRLLDVVTDPAIGVLSDRLRLPLGRRKPWMLLGTPLFMISLWKIFVPGETASALYLAGWSALLYLGFAMIDSDVDLRDHPRGHDGAGCPVPARLSGHQAGPR